MRFFRVYKGWKTTPVMCELLPKPLYIYIYIYIRIPVIKELVFHGKYPGFFFVAQMTQHRDVAWRFGCFALTSTINKVDLEFEFL